MLAAQPDKSIMNVYNFQKVCITQHALFYHSFILRLPGPTRFEDRAARKTLRNCRGSAGGVVCRRHSAGSDISVGG